MKIVEYWVIEQVIVLARKEYRSSYHLPNTQDGSNNHDDNKTWDIKVMSFVIVNASRAFLPFDRRFGPVGSKFDIECDLEKRDKVAGPADTDYLGTRNKSALLISSNKAYIYTRTAWQFM